MPALTKPAAPGNHASVQEAQVGSPPHSHSHASLGLASEARTTNHLLCLQLDLISPLAAQALWDHSPAW